jgi:hypothetical protein
VTSTRFPLNLMPCNTSSVVEVAPKSLLMVKILAVFRNALPPDPVKVVETARREVSRQSRPTLERFIIENHRPAAILHIFDRPRRYCSATGRADGSSDARNALAVGNDVSGGQQ